MIEHERAFQTIYEPTINPYGDGHRSVVGCKCGSRVKVIETWITPVKPFDPEERNGQQIVCMESGETVFENERGR